MRLFLGILKRRGSRSQSSSLPSSIGAPDKSFLKNIRHHDSYTPRTLDSSSENTRISGRQDRDDGEEYGNWRDCMATLASDLQVQPAEQFYCHALTNEGRDTAIEPLQSESKSNLVSLAVSYFHRGCELWAQDDLSYALSQLKLSKSIWERYSPSLTFLLQAFGNDSKSSEQELAGNTEFVAQLYYALGTVHLSMKHCLDALKSFRSALQVTALGLGVEHDLFGAILYMMRLTLLTMGFSSPKIHEYIKHFRRELTKESRADMYAAAGRIEKALMKYEALSFVWDSDWQAKARVKTKIATMHEENGNLLKATREWSIISALYKEVANLDKENPLRQMTREKEMILFNTLDRIEI